MNLDHALARILLLVLPALLTACAASQTAPPAPAVAMQAAAHDTVWVVTYPVKADHRPQFEAFIRDFWTLGRRAEDPQTRRTFAQTRVLFPGAASADGTYGYMILMDPLITGAEYEIPVLLRRLASADEAARLGRLFSESIGGRYTAHLMVQSSF